MLDVAGTTVRYRLCYSICEVSAEMRSKAHDDALHETYQRKFVHNAENSSMISEYMNVDEYLYLEIGLEFLLLHFFTYHIT